MARFPPRPVYPVAYDSDYTLFKVYNTSESVTTEDNSAWAEEVPIEPVGKDEAEIWGHNGFASIGDELFYYDTVVRNENGKVCALRRCARGFAGNRTKDNPAGSWVRGPVVADVHNQMATTIMAVERFLTDMDATLSMLEELPNVPDDCCVQPSLSFRQNGSNSYNYSVNVTGDYSSAVLDFGDGNSTANTGGTYAYCGIPSHEYGSETPVNPVLTVQSKNCTMAITPSHGPKNRRHATPKDRTKHPKWPVTDVCFVDTSLPDFPVLPSPLKLPPIQFPLLEMPDVYAPSIVIGPNMPSEIKFVNSPDIPDNIIVVDNIPSVIKVESDIPSVIRLEATVELVCGHQHHDWDEDDFNHYDAMGFTGEGFLDGFDMADEFVPDSIGLGIPSEIHIIAPRMPNIKVIHDLPAEIRINAPYIPSEIHIPELAGKTIPTDIHMHGFVDIPKEIMLVATSNIPQTIFVSGESLPDMIPLKVTGIPDEIKMTGLRDIAVTGIPSTIRVEVPHIPEKIHIVTDRIPEKIGLKLESELPTYIFIDASQIPKEIRVTGMPDSITVNVTVPELPPLKFEKETIELVYNGGPLPIQFPIADLVGSAGDDVPRYAIIPMPCK